MITRFEEEMVSKLNKVCPKVSYGHRPFKLQWAVADDGDFTCHVANCSNWERNGLPCEIEKILALEKDTVKIQDKEIGESGRFNVDIFITREDAKNSPPIQELIAKEQKWAEFKFKMKSILFCQNCCEGKSEELKEPLNIKQKVTI